METHPNCKTRRRNSRGPVCSSFVSAQSDTHDASNSNANSAAGIISAKSVLHKVFEPNVLLAHKSAIRQFPLVRGPTDLKKVLKVSATNGTVKILSARDLVNWRTRDYYKLRSSDVVLIKKPASGDDMEALLVLLPRKTREGHFMNAEIPENADSRSASFRQITDAFLSQDGLPFSEVLTAEKIQNAFGRNSGLFGMNDAYSTVIVVWAFLSQVLKDGKEASCQSAVARIVSHCLEVGVEPPTADTGDYCKARAKLSLKALHELSNDVAADLEQRADETWSWKKRHAKLIDGFTVTMPATPENEAEFPHPRTQRKGVGLPIARAVAILSLATAAVMDAAIGPYQGKETGESALLRSLLPSLLSGDIAVFDRYYCSFMMFALLLNQRVDVCARLHHLRHVDFRKGQQLCHPPRLNRRNPDTEGTSLESTTAAPSQAVAA